jgi:organic radical activating enzyme
MRHYLINTTWKCQLACSYCWVRRHVNKQPGLDAMAERPYEDWLAALRRDPPDVCDIGGGEPLALPWTLELVRALPGIEFGINTNGLNVDRIDELAACRLANVVNVNLSYHPEAARHYGWYNSVWKRNVLALQEAGYQLSPNLMRTTPRNQETAQWAIEWLKAHGLHMVVSPCCGGREESKHLQDWPGLTCEAGVNHITVGPDGTAWPCLSALWSAWWAETSLGNWLDGPLDLSRKRQPCRLYCAEYRMQYQEHESGDFWHTNVRPMAETAGEVAQCAV